MSSEIDEILRFAEHSVQSIDAAPISEDEKKSSLILIAQEILDMCKCGLISYKGPK